MKSQTSSSRPSRRSYDSSRRKADAKARQRRIVDAAHVLFLEHGYGATSIEEIARAADVSVQSVYATFESKAGVLSRVVDVAIAGDDEDLSVGERPETMALLGEQDVVARLRGMAHHARAAHARSASLLRVVETASGADPALGRLHEGLAKGVRVDTEAFAKAIPADALRDGVTPGDVADLMYVLASARTWTDLVDELGWSPDRYEAWLADTVSRLILPG
jgi:AcrR family transcriptional regulator